MHNRPFYRSGRYYKPGEPFTIQEGTLPPRDAVDAQTGEPHWTPEMLATAEAERRERKKLKAKEGEQLIFVPIPLPTPLPGPKAPPDKPMAMSEMSSKVEKVGKGAKKGSDLSDFEQ
jgi:hypothetical protein